MRTLTLAPTKLDRLRAAAEHCLALGVTGRGRAVHEAAPELVRRLDALHARIVECEAGGYTRAEIGAEVWPVREMLAASSLGRRLQFSPRGHQADVETLERLDAGVNREPVGTMAYLVEEAMLRGPLADLLFARVARQRAALHDTLLARRGARILVLGAGPALEVRQLAELVHARQARLVLHDEDPAALVHARERLGAAAAHATLVAGEPLRSIERLAAEGPYDLVLLGGLLDEQRDGRAVALLHAIHDELLAPGGRLVATAMAAGGPARPALDYFSDWVVVARTERELARLCHLAGASELSVVTDPAAHLLVADVRRADVVRRAA